MEYPCDDLFGKTIDGVSCRRTLELQPTSMQYIKLQRGHSGAMHQHYIFVDSTLIRHSSFALGPLAALQTLLDHATVVLTAIGPPVASAPRELCYCIVRVIRVFIYLLLASVKPPWFGLARLGDSPTFLCSRESDYPFNKAWLVLPAGCVIVDRENVVAVGYYLLH